MASFTAVLAAASVARRPAAACTGVVFGGNTGDLPLRLANVTSCGRSTLAGANGNFTVPDCGSTRSAGSISGVLGGGGRGGHQRLEA